MFYYSHYLFLFKSHRDKRILCLLLASNCLSQNVHVKTILMRLPGARRSVILTPQNQSISSKYCLYMNKLSYLIKVTSFREVFGR